MESHCPKPSQNIFLIFVLDFSGIKEGRCKVQWNETNPEQIGHETYLKCLCTFITLEAVLKALWNL